uniref:Uncharacterized protein LOC104241863 n=1 Tax=Nicotiana sylvestris TaxID=4096 RepID=A0A1U7XZP3_NICSY|nr:PREDICTED: uncharacterized protein LOC104241863 [Nicotiana sylvestris]
MDFFCTDDEAIVKADLPPICSLSTSPLNRVNRKGFHWSLSSVEKDLTTSNEAEITPMVTVRSCPIIYGVFLIPMKINCSLPSIMKPTEKLEFQIGFVITSTTAIISGRNPRYGPLKKLLPVAISQLLSSKPSAHSVLHLDCIITMPE